MDDKLLKLRSVLKTMPLNDNQINNILGIVDIQNKEIYDTITPLLEEYYSYGIERDYTNSSPNCIRIGNLDLHRSLPIQSKMRGCLLDDDGNVVEYLPENDWTTATRDGSKGQVMVEIPMHYRKFETKGTKHIVRLSEYPLSGYHQVPKMYVSAYEASIEHSSGKLCSVVNNDIDYRGGDNNAEWDETYRSLLGRPITNMNRTQFRSAARKHNTSNTSWNCYLYQIHKALFWLYVIEYANLNSQLNYTSKLTENGFRNGGLGMGISNFGEQVNWNTFNNMNPFIPCGYTDTLGNKTGIMDYTIYNEDGLKLNTLSVPRYRGIENLFGHIWKYTDGINIRISPTDANGGDNLSKVYICEDHFKLNDMNYNGYKYIGNESRSNGYIKEIIFGKNGEIIPSIISSETSTTFFCDYHYSKISEKEILNGVLFGGNANYNVLNGLSSIATTYAPSFFNTNTGSRLCFIPEQNKNQIK